MGEKIYMKTEKIARGGITLTIIVLSFILFRGSTSLLGSLIIPLAIYINLYDFNLSEFLFTITAATILVAILFWTQVLFMIVYGFLAYMLSLWTRKNLFMRIILLSLTAALSFFTAIYLTDLLLGTAIQHALTTLMGGSHMGFYLMVLLEGIITGGTLSFLGPWLESRLLG